MSELTNPQWKNPNEVISIFRCTEAEYANQFLENGTIKFNSPNSWVEYAKKQSEGRGDMLEGTIAFYNINDFENMKRINNKYLYYDKTNQLIRERIGNRVFLKIKHTMGLPCFCFYALTLGMFPCPQDIGETFLDSIIPYSYFRDFADNMKDIDINLLPINKRPSVLWITNIEEFKKKY